MLAMDELFKVHSYSYRCGKEFFKVSIKHLAIERYVATPHKLIILRFIVFIFIQHVKCSIVTW